MAPSVHIPATRARHTADMSDCVFCSIVAGETAADVVYRDDRVMAFLDRSPVFKGHVLVVPTTHVPTLTELPVAEIGHYFTTVQRIASAVPTALQADGTFVAINNVVSQSVPHLHTHVVPRRRKDGLRGFFWPRVKYADALEAEQFAALIRARLAAE
ncbi:MAG: HIT family protein [Ilumatobacteraceae bacterium]